MAAIRTLLVGVFSIVLIAACATQTHEIQTHESLKIYSAPRGEITSPPALSADKGRIWFYRNQPRTAPGFWPGTTPGFWLDILLDNKIVAKATPYQVYCVDVNPGTYEVAINEDKVTITVEKQQNVFIKTVLSGGNYLTSRLIPTVVDPEIGIYDSGIGGNKIPDDYLYKELEKFSNARKGKSGSKPDYRHAKDLMRIYGRENVMKILDDLEK